MAQTYDVYTDENGNKVDGLGMPVGADGRPQTVNAGYAYSAGYGVPDPTATQSSADKFIDALKLNPEEQARYDDSGVKGWVKQKFGMASAYDGQGGYKVVADIIADRTPDQLVDALEAANPESKEITNLVRGDRELKNALHNAFAKDPTVLEGIGTLIGKDSAFTPDQVKAMLTDPENRRLMIGMLKGVAESDLEFKDMADGLNDGFNVSKDPMNAEKRQKWQQTLAKFDLEDNRMAFLDQMNDPMAMLNNLINDPRGFAAGIMSMIGDSIPPEYQDMVAGFVSFATQGVAAFIDPNGDWLGHYYQGGKEIASGIGASWKEEGSALNGIARTVSSGIESASVGANEIAATGQKLSEAFIGPAVGDDLSGDKTRQVVAEKDMGAYSLPNQQVAATSWGLNS